MKKLLGFIFWPALAGLVFAFTLLQAPRLVEVMPGLAAYFPQPVAPVVTSTSTLSFNDAIQKSAPAVVSINYKETAARITERLDDYEFILEEDNNSSLGSGVIIRPDGFIITSYHVVFSDDVERLFWDKELLVTLQDGRNLEARVVSVDEKSDLALLKVDAEQLPSLNLANLGGLQVGDVVLAIGNPRNVGQSVTQGIISALLHRDDSFMIQTDAAINPGNSGGGLIDIDGNLIGINSTIVSESGGSEGIGFSIPADMAMNLLEQYLASGPSGYLGVSAGGLSLADGQLRFGQDVQGIEINEVNPNSPADKAGLKVGDIITGVGEQKLEIRNPPDRDQAKAEANAAVSYITSRPPGELVKIEVFRDGIFLQIPVTLGVGEPEIYEVPIEVTNQNRDGLPVRPSIN